MHFIAFMQAHIHHVSKMEAADTMVLFVRIHHED